MGVPTTSATAACGDKLTKREGLGGRRLSSSGDGEGRRIWAWVKSCETWWKPGWNLEECGLNDNWSAVVKSMASHRLALHPTSMMKPFCHEVTINRTELAGLVGQCLGIGLGVCSLLSILQLGQLASPLQAPSTFKSHVWPQRRWFLCHHPFLHSHASPFDHFYRHLMPNPAAHMSTSQKFQ